VPFAVNRVALGQYVRIPCHSRSINAAYVVFHSFTADTVQTALGRLLNKIHPPFYCILNVCDLHLYHQLMHGGRIKSVTLFVSWCLVLKPVWGKINKRTCSNKSIRASYPIFPDVICIIYIPKMDADRHNRVIMQWCLCLSM